MATSKKVSKARQSKQESRWSIEEDVISRVWWSPLARAVWSQGFAEEKRAGHSERVVKAAFTDPKFRKRLLSESKSVIKELGLRPRSGLRVKFVENTAETIHVVLPALMTPRQYEALKKVDLKDGDLKSVSRAPELRMGNKDFTKVQQGDGFDYDQDMLPAQTDPKGGNFKLVYRDRD